MFKIMDSIHIAQLVERDKRLDSPPPHTIITTQLKDLLYFICYVWDRPLLVLLILNYLLLFHFSYCVHINKHTQPVCSLCIGECWHTFYRIKYARTWNIFDKINKKYEINMHLTRLPMTTSTFLIHYYRTDYR